MRKVRKLFPAVLIAAVVMILLAASPALSIWQVLVDEDFDKDQTVATLRWPWGTPPQNPTIRWHYNPRPNWYRAEIGVYYENYTWGLQNWAYNVLVRRHARFPASIWCAYTNRDSINNPRWPEDDDYMDNQNAWAWWGPIDLRQAKNAAVIFWYYNDIDPGVRDSLVVCMVNNDNYLTIGKVPNTNPPRPDTTAMRTLPAYGRFMWIDSAGDEHWLLTTFKTRPLDWQRRQFFLNDLRKLDNRGRELDTVVNWCRRPAVVNDRDTILAGERRVWLCFVWQSNERVIGDKGAFIDDVMVVWDDGLFDIRSSMSYIGIPINEDSTRWNNDYTPRTGDQLRFRSDWTVVGDGEVPEFTIRLKIDDEYVYSEVRRGIFAGDTTYTSIADTIWTVTPGAHTITWELDTPLNDGGVVRETREDNNTGFLSFNVEWNPAPELDINSPFRDMTEVFADSTWRIHYVVQDSNETDTTFTVYLYFTDDTSGLAANPELMYDYNYINHTFRGVVGESSMLWNVRRDWNAERVVEGGVYYICGFATDGYPGNLTQSFAIGRVVIRGPQSAPPLVDLPRDYALTRAFPNPFNRALTIDYVLPAAGSVRIAIYDLTGRFVETLVEGQRPAGQQTVVWRPTNVGAGLYLIKMEAGGKTFLQKAVFAP
ncbi:MAG: T9SS type A sorting domain-containing protein [Calditrichaeota bacterium]|nr:T9SS type A sorting domain-containing protein [Calditrichota bacterium]